MLRLVATYADLWNAEGPLRRPEAYALLREAGDSACQEVGRPPSTLGRSAAVVISLPMAQSAVHPSAATQERLSELASQKEVAETLRGFAQEGLSHVQLWLTPSDIAGLEWLVPVLKMLDRA